MQKSSTRLDRINAARAVADRDFPTFESPRALRIPYLDRQPWECASVLGDGTLCGLPITNYQFRWCAECAERFLAPRKAKP